MKGISLWLSIILLWFQSVFATADVWVLLTDNESEFGAEFIEALRFSYDNGLTKFKTVETFRPYEELTREQASKILGVFAQQVMEYTTTSPRNCDFNDVDQADPSLLIHIQASCKLWIFKGTPGGNFFPSQALTKAEAIAVIIRMFNRWSLDESTDPRYMNYYLEARELELTKEKNISSLDRPLTRYEMILLLYRFYVKYSLLEKLNANVGLLDENESITLRSVGNGIIVINSNEFLDETVEKILAEIDGSYYTLEKSNLITQFENAYTWYGDVYLLEDTDDTVGTYVGVSTFNLVNGVVSDGNIRPTELYDWYYQIDISDIRPFYEAIKMWEWSDEAQTTTTVSTTNNESSSSSNAADTAVTTIDDICSMLELQWQCEELASCKWKRTSCWDTAPTYSCLNTNDTFTCDS